MEALEPQETLPKTASIVKVEIMRNFIHFKLLMLQAKMRTQWRLTTSFLFMPQEAKTKKDSLLMSPALIAVMASLSAKAHFSFKEVTVNFYYKKILKLVFSQVWWTFSLMRSKRIWLATMKPLLVQPITICSAPKSGREWTFSKS